MDILGEERRRAFTVWLRTGRWPRVQAAEVETKYNHWHDQRNGQFTFSGTGQREGSWTGGGFTGGGGGSFGGAGASGSWGAGGRRARLQGQRRPAASSSAEASSGVTVLPAPKHVGVAEPGSANPKPFSPVERNGYEYRIDDEKRTRSVSGTLTLSDTQARSRREQTAAGLPDRKPQDDGGHYIAARFNGPTDAFNHFAQDANLNRGTYRVMEDQWARAKKNGKSVAVRIAPAYVGSSRRPSAINVWFWINGQRESLNFRNEPKEARRGK